MTSRNKISRRAFLSAGLLTTASFLLPHKAVAAVSGLFSAERALSFYNTHTGEKLKAVYWQQDAYVPQALVDINYILRDYRTGEVKEIDPGLLDLLCVLRENLESNDPFSIISGYRSPETNAQLCSVSKGVVSNSMHISGKAIDIRLPGCDLKTLRRAAVDLRRGGVGYYPSSDFVHVDVGRVRYW
ncbi:MAG TPA: YcbK family protein [Thermodesulfovibrionales bacterium]|nr:YcbK family protein [Thermodesulfovibrionales bacterium]